MNENGKISGIYSWPAIVIAFLFFWPVGVFLLIKRVSLDKKAAMNVGKIVGIVGACSYGMAAIGIIACFPSDFGSDDITMILFFLVAGFVMRKVAKKIQSEAEKVKEYLAIIVNGNIHQIDNIAATTGRSYDVVKADIQMMIKKGYLKNAYLDESMSEVVLPDNRPIINATPVSDNMTVEKTVVTKVIACPCCGANNTIVGAQGECEYCGSPIK